MRRLLMLEVIGTTTFVLFARHAFGQEKTPVEVTQVTKVAFLNPGFSYEDRIAKFQTVYLTAHMATNASYSYSSAFGSSSTIYFDPALMLQYRYYYNAGTRQSKGKRTERNSLNYIGPLFDVTFSKVAIKESSYEEGNRRPVYTGGFVWGIQRNYRKRFSLDLNLGIGYFFTKGTELDYNSQVVHVNQSGLSTPGNFSLGFWLNKR